MENVYCPICESPKNTVVMKSIDAKVSKAYFNIVECNECSFKYTNPRPSFNEIFSFYSTNYYSYRPPRIILSTNITKNDKKFLEIGCGSGKTLIKKYNEGYEVFGTEINPEVVETLQNSGLRVELADLSSLPFEDDSFDEILANHVLEHVHDVKKIIAEAFRCLKTGGSFHICLPNIESFESRIHGSSWRHLDVPRHLHHFSPKSAIRILKDSGFSEIQYRTSDLPVFDRNLNYLKAQYTTIKTAFHLSEGAYLKRIIKSFAVVFINFIRYIFHKTQMDDGFQISIVAKM